MDSKGNTYICEREGNGVRKVDANGVMSTFAGTGERGYSGDGGPALAATWGAPKAIRCDNQDNVIVVDTENPGFIGRFVVAWTWPPVSSPPSLAAA